MEEFPIARPTPLEPDYYLAGLYDTLTAQNRTRAIQAHATLPPPPHPSAPRVAPATELAKAGVRSVLQRRYDEERAAIKADRARAEDVRAHWKRGFTDDGCGTSVNMRPSPSPTTGRSSRDGPLSPTRAHAPPPASTGLDCASEINGNNIREPSPEPVERQIGTTPPPFEPAREASVEIVEVRQVSAQLAEAERERSVEVISSSREPSVEFVGEVRASSPRVVLLDEHARAAAAVPPESVQADSILSYESVRGSSPSLQDVPLEYVRQPSPSNKRSRDDFETATDALFVRLRDRGVRGVEGRPNKVRRTC